MVRFIDSRVISAAALSMCVAFTGCQTFDGSFSGRSLFGSKSDQQQEQYATNANDTPANADYGSDGLAVADNGFGGSGRDRQPSNSSANRRNGGSIESDMAAGRAALQRHGKLASVDPAGAAQELNAAKAAFRRVVQSQNNNAEAHHQLAIVADLQKDFREAEFRYREAIKFGVNYPKLADLYSDMGYSFLLQERFANSEDALKKALHFDPAHRMAANNYGALYARTGDRDRALAMFRKGGTEAQAQKHMRDFFPDAGAPANGMNPIELATATNPFANNQTPMNNTPNWNPQYGDRSNFPNPPTGGPPNGLGATPWPNGQPSQPNSGFDGAPTGGLNSNNTLNPTGGFGRPSGLGTRPGGLGSNQFANNSGFGNTNPNPNEFGNTTPNTLQTNPNNFDSSNWNGGTNGAGSNPLSSIPHTNVPNSQGNSFGNNNGLNPGFGEAGNAPPSGNPGYNSGFNDNSRFNNAGEFNNNSGGFNNPNPNGLNSGPSFNGLNGAANSSQRPSVPGTLQPNPAAWAGGGLNNSNGVDNSGAQAAMDFGNPLLPINSNPGSASGIPSAPIMRPGAGSMHGSQFPQAGQYQPPARLPGTSGLDVTGRQSSIPGQLRGVGSGLNGTGSGFNNNPGLGNTNTQFANTNPLGNNTQFGGNAGLPNGNTNPVSNFQNQMQQFPTGQGTQLGSQPNTGFGSFDNPVNAQY